MSVDHLAVSAAPLLDTDLSAGAVRPLRPRSHRLQTSIGVLISALMLICVLYHLRHVGLQPILATMERSPAFWAVFVLLYLAQPLTELVIFRRLWRLPASGLGVLLRKGVINEIVFGYSGEAYFYLWARERGQLTNAPFAAIKDVNILSALVGNAMTLAVILLAAPGLHAAHLGRLLNPVFWSAAVVAASSLLIVLFARRVFSLGRNDLAFVSGLHALRVLATTGLTILLWRLELPEVAVGVWLLLAALRLLVARLPFLTNKDLVFANLAFLVIGRQTEIGALLGTLAVMTLIAHLAVVLLLAAPDALKAVRGE